MALINVVNIAVFFNCTNHVNEEDMLLIMSNLIIYRKILQEVHFLTMVIMTFFTDVYVTAS